ncbi:MAG: dihydropteroate synthase [Proteobacteria bacterium]|nr:dihydropteroate synthase [Pseudomonadota bacterium]
MLMGEQGSALPRSLSSLASLYLAPTDIPTIFRLGIRTGPAGSSYHIVTEPELEDWAETLEDSHRTPLKQQLATLSGFQQARATYSPKIMGILNVTPDSFSDGGEHFERGGAVSHAEKMIEDGAQILDVGGESTRPGAEAVSISEEINRVVPVIEECRDLGVRISIDSRKKAVMEAAVDAGATMINDVTALEYDPESLEFVASKDLPVCLMHSSADPKVMQDNPQYDNVVFDVIDYLNQRIQVCEAAGIAKESIVIDPGIGFGKTLEHNLQLIQGLPYFHTLGCDILLGASRKSFIGKITGEAEAQNRISGSVSAALFGLNCGVQILRVHDVAETRQALEIWQSVKSATF